LNITERINANFSKKVKADAWVKYVRNRIDWGDGENFSYLFLPNLSLDYQIAKIISIHGKAAYTEWFNETSSERNQLFHPEFWFNLDISQYNHLVIGTDYSSNVFTRTSVNEHTQTANGFFIQDQHKFNSKYTAELGLRIDMVKNLDPVITPRLAILYNPKDHFSLRFGYSRGFRAPTPQDLYEEGYGHGGSALRFGNPDLLPEYSNTISMSAFLLIRERLYVDASAYYSLINNMIVPVYEGPWYEVDSTKDIWRRQNILKANIVSGQVGLKYLVSDNYAIHASYSYSDNFSSTEDSHQLPYNPGQSLNIKITGKQNIRNKLTIHEFVSLRAVTGRTAWNWKPSSEINDASGLITALEDYQKLDAGITFSILNKYDIYLNVSNILGQDIQNLDDALTIIDGEPVYTIGLKLKLN
jgi:outer membrane receptor protein involved in Fe transport